MGIQERCERRSNLRGGAEDFHSELLASVKLAGPAFVRAGAFKRSKLADAPGLEGDLGVVALSAGTGCENGCLDSLGIRRWNEKDQFEHEAPGRSLDNSAPDALGLWTICRPIMA